MQLIMSSEIMLRLLLACIVLFNVNLHMQYDDHANAHNCRRLFESDDQMASEDGRCGSRCIDFVGDMHRYIWINDARMVCVLCVCMCTCVYMWSSRAQHSCDTCVVFSDVVNVIIYLTDGE